MRSFFSALFLLLCHTLSFGQSMLDEAFQEFAFSRFWQNEEIRIEWKMQGKVQADLNEGLNNLLEEKPGLAESDFTAVIAKDSSVWQAYYYRGVSRKQQKKFEDATLDLKHALTLNPGLYEGYVELAKVYCLLKNIEGSEHVLKKAIQIDTKKPIAHYLRGDINLSQGQQRAAIRNYENCLSIDSLFHDARMKLVIIDLIEKKNNDHALQKLNRILQYDSLQKNALLFRALLLSEKNKEQSVKDLSNLILVSPMNVMARYLRGTYLANLKKYYEAFNDFHEVIRSTSVSDNEFAGKQSWLDKKIDLQNVGSYILTRVYGLPDDDALKVKQGFCMIITQEFAPAIGVLNQVSNAANEPLCPYLIAVAYEHNGDHLFAYRMYSMALKLDNDIADAHKKRGIYEQNMKLWHQSIEDFNTVLRLTPDAFVIYKLRGISYFNENKFPEAIADFSLFLQHDSTNKEVLGFRGMSYLRNNQRLNAYDDFARSKNVQTFDFKDMKHLVDSMLVTGDTIKTLFYLDHFTQAAAYFTEGYALKFKIHLKRQEWDPIKKEIARSLRNSRANADNRDHSYLLTLQAMVLAMHNHHDDAIQLLNEAIRFDKENALAYLERGKVFRKLAKESKALNDFEKAIALGNEEAKSLVHD